jgi:dTDP-4-dehydrorhamnose 3,5-epimerase
VHLAADSKGMLWIPPGFAHQFRVTSEHAEFLHKTTDYWMPEHERTVAWNDPDLAVDWRLYGAPVLYAKDAKGMPVAQAETYP